jgi:chromosome segregation ATPase
MKTEQRLPDHCPHTKRDGLVCLPCAYARIDALHASLERVEAENVKLLAEIKRCDEAYDERTAKLERVEAERDQLQKELARVLGVPDGAHGDLPRSG